MFSLNFRNAFLHLAMREGCFGAVLTDIPDTIPGEAEEGSKDCIGTFLSDTPVSNSRDADEGI